MKNIKYLMIAINMTTAFYNPSILAMAPRKKAALIKKIEAKLSQLPNVATLEALDTLEQEIQADIQALPRAARRNFPERLQTIVELRTDQLVLKAVKKQLSPEEQKQIKDKIEDYLKQLNLQLSHKEFRELRQKILVNIAKLPEGTAREFELKLQKIQTEWQAEQEKKLKPVLEPFSEAYFVQSIQEINTHIEELTTVDNLATLNDKEDEITREINALPPEYEKEKNDLEKQLKEEVAKLTKQLEPLEAQRIAKLKSEIEFGLKQIPIEDEAVFDSLIDGLQYQIDQLPEGSEKQAYRQQLEQAVQQRGITLPTIPKTIEPGQLNKATEAYVTFNTNLKEQLKALSFNNQQRENISFNKMIKQDAVSINTENITRFVKDLNLHIEILIENITNAALNDNQLRNRALLTKRILTTNLFYNPGNQAGIVGKLVEHIKKVNISNEEKQATITAANEFINSFEKLRTIRQTDQQKTSLETRLKSMKNALEQAQQAAQ